MSARQYNHRETKHSRLVFMDLARANKVVNATSRCLKRCAGRKRSEIQRGELVLRPKPRKDFPSSANFAGSQRCRLWDVIDEVSGSAE